MPETFLILFAGGVVLAAALSNPQQVTLRWLRLSGIIALSLAALSLFFFLRQETRHTLVQQAAYATAVTAILAQLGFVQMAWRRAQRFFATAAFVAAVMVGMIVLPASAGRGAPIHPAIILLSLTGIAAMTGMVLMEMLLGHAYLNTVLAFTLAARTATAVGLPLWIESRHPLPMFWGVYGLLIGTRWLVGLALPAVFIYMAHDCIKRRATQAATGILYVAGVVVMIGELLALMLLRDTGLPF